MAIENLLSAPSAGLAELYDGFRQEHLVALWTEIGDLMPAHPGPGPCRTCGAGARGCCPGRRAGELVPVGRGGERRAIALANPGLAGAPFATPTLWAAIQYLKPREDAPVHRHTQNAFRFVVEGEGVWTVVNGDPVAMRRGDFLPQAGWNWHAPPQRSDTPMAWIDGLDIPFQHYRGSTSSSRDPTRWRREGRAPRSRSERLWGHPGLRPLDPPRARHPGRRCSPTGGSTPTARWPTSWRWRPRATRPRWSPGTRRSGTPTPPPGPTSCRRLRAEFHRIAPGASTAPRRETGSSCTGVRGGRRSQGRGQVLVGRSAATCSSSRPGRP